MGKGKEGESSGSGSGSGQTSESQGGIRSSVVSLPLTPLGLAPRPLMLTYIRY